MTTLTREQRIKLRQQRRAAEAMAATVALAATIIAVAACVQTGEACVKTGRRFIGIERDEEYFNTACRRIEQAYADQDLFAGACA